MTVPSFDPILVPTDLSEPSLEAVRHAAALAGRLGSRVVLTYVVDDRTLPPSIRAQDGATLSEILERHEAQARRSLDEAAARFFGGRPVEVVVRRGVDHVAIVELATELHAGLIVMGMHGHGFLVHALAGSTAERVLHHAPCPVMVVGAAR